MEGAFELLYNFSLPYRLGSIAGHSARVQIHEKHDGTEAAMNREGMGSQTAQGGG